jgi:VanZ family protein
VVVVLALAYLAAMFAATHMPTRLPTSMPVRGLDKAVHFVAYAGLAIVLMAAANVFWRTGVRTALGVIIVAAIYGALDEWTQGFVPGRSAELRDWVADVLGAAVGAGLYLAANCILRQRTSRA